MRHELVFVTFRYETARVFLTPSAAHADILSRLGTDWTATDGASPVRVAPIPHGVCFHRGTIGGFSIWIDVEHVPAPRLPRLFWGRWLYLVRTYFDLPPDPAGFPRNRGEMTLFATKWGARRFAKAPTNGGRLSEYPGDPIVRLAAPRGGSKGPFDRMWEGFRAQGDGE